MSVQRAQLAVDIGRLHFQLSQRLNRAAVSMRPVQAGSGEQLDVAALDARMHAVAVVLDLVQPALPLGASFTKRVSCGLIQAAEMSFPRTQSKSHSQHIAQKHVRLPLWYDAAAPGALSYSMA